ncbi:hypothetical protein AEP_00550 [Curvibacter sp. AEP1-3]|uniref:hypothetical protein n=1 Tax=Curvibacter sp. AEP1-3 TaxID=1844971 RepID=UPI000B3D3029|nr:hypothetical protein [Curvibacter sp. AEP1-3]ARV17510.1 hypothetical protein AEP_00550 [Curvibacter sp. AEP1-3]
MNPFAQIAATLTAHTVPAWNASEVKPQGLSRTETIRQLLKSASRPVSAAEIAFDMDEFPNFGTHLVWLLLKYDIQKGRVLFQDGKYRWNHAYDTAEAEAIRAAVKLLKNHGYKVKEPS